MKLGRVGACLAFLSSMLLITALPSTAAAYPGERGYGQGEFSVGLFPDEVVGGGDYGGRGLARLTFNEVEESACYFIGWRGLEGRVTAAQLRYAPRGINGPLVINFFDGERLIGDRDGSWSCVRVTDDRYARGMSARAKIRDIIENPEYFYVTVDSTRHPDGALRGQLD